MDDSDAHLLVPEGLKAEFEMMRESFKRRVFPSADLEELRAVDATFCAGAYALACLVRRTFNEAAQADEETRLRASRSLLALFELTDALVSDHVRSYGRGVSH